jgi:hypothetical protein
MEMSSQFHDPADVTPPVPVEQEDGWDPKSVWVVLENRQIFFLPGFKPRIIGPVASLSIEYVIFGLMKVAR